MSLDTSNIRLRKTTVRRLLLAAGVLGLRMNKSPTYDDVVNIALDPIVPDGMTVSAQACQTEEAPVHA